MIGIYPPTFDELVALNNGIAGSPETVRRFIAAEIEANRCNYFVPQMVFGDMTLAEALRSIELFAQGDHAGVRGRGLVNAQPR